MSPVSKNATLDRMTGPAVKWLLIGIAGASTHTIAISSDVFRVGRRADMDLCLDSLSVSGCHGEFFLVQDFLFFRDLGSTNGSFLNGTRVTRDVELRDGDCLDLGGTTFRVVRRSHDSRSLPPASLSAMLKTNSLLDQADAIGERSLTRLFSGGSLAPCYQAIFNLRTSELAGYEFLARSTYPGIETAGRLFGQSARTGREVELSFFCRQQAFFHAHLTQSDVPVFVNTHPAEPLLDGVLPQMRDLRQEYPDRAMVLEIHEAAYTEPGLIRELRRQLASVNIRLAFDDFGAGQTRIREMICASADYIKFDPSLIRDLQQASKERRRFLASILAGINGEGTITVAEGIETAEMAEVCHDVGFDLVQGYLYGRPTILQ